MKKINRIFLLVFVCTSIFQLNAQNFRLQGGLNLANMIELDNDFVYSSPYKLNAGAQIGLIYHLPLTKVLSFETGMLYSVKGFRIKDTIAGLDFTAKLKLNYLDIPILFKATHDFGDGLKIFGAFGSYIGIGVTGIRRVTGESQATFRVNDKEIKWGNDDRDDLKRFDMGFTFGAGLEVNSYVIGFLYDLGLANIAANQENGYSISNSVIRLSFGYKIGSN